MEFGPTPRRLCMEIVMYVSARPIMFLVVVSAALSLLGCGRSGNKFVPPPPPDVTVSLPEKKSVTDYLEATGTAAALESVDIRARVEGWLDEIKFQPRAKVKKDDLLFVIDPRPFQAKVDQSRAVLEAKKADLKLAQIEWEKAKYLLEKAAISELKFDEAVAKRDIAKADVGIAEANLETAKLDLNYTLVKSPIDGRVSRNLVDVGNLVGAAQKTELATVVNDESIYAYFSLSEREFLPLSRDYIREAVDPESGREKSARPSIAYLGLSDEEGYPHKGKIDYAGTQVDPNTGTIQVRAIFPNADGLILQGMFVRIRIPIATRESLLVPDVAVQADQAGRYVLIVNDRDVVEQRQVTVGGLDKRMRVITKGLTEKDRVIVNGLQRARPGSKVKPQKADAPSATPNAAEKPVKTGTKKTDTAAPDSGNQDASKKHSGK